MTRILILDGSTDESHDVERLIQDHPNWSFEHVRDPNVALQRLTENETALLLADVSTLATEDYKFHRQIQRRFRELPVVVMVPSGPDAAVVAALRIGAASYIPRSSMARDLQTTVERILALRRPQEQDARLFACLAKSEHCFLLENDTSLVAPVVSFFQSQIDRIGRTTFSARMRIATAIEEALMNAIIHGNLEIGSELRQGDPDAYRALIERRQSEEPYASRRVFVQAGIQKDTAEFVIRDEGRGFDSSLVPDPRDEENLLKVSGRGLLLMTSFMEVVRFNDCGNEVTMVANIEVEEALDDESDLQD